ncbi:Sec7 domain-containing protein [Metschnikowia aff. pulcherrima]|uniref:Guanine-nucleotide exchange factor YEL1 n=1 Tax=Metschnikowia aff. pulcherrima TaxID=2163413 RepID=A0A4P6XN77_9ASCO|nr:Sec7 domain-containing protein [Metschnikowia aff. pulcherrima]
MPETSHTPEILETQKMADSDRHLTGSPETLIEGGSSKNTESAEIEEVSDTRQEPVTPSKTDTAKETPKRTVSNGNSTLSQHKVLSQLSAGEINDIATKLFNESFLLISPEEYTQFLAALDQESTAIRECYMDLFEWDASLVKATRELCLKLYLKGESQEIDRLLSAFTKSYLKQHPENVFCTQDFEQIYIVLYSLILLNTSLHNAEVGKKAKLSQSDYIRNTLTTFLLQNKKASRALTVKQKIKIERELNMYYEDLAQRELYLKKGDAPETPKKTASANRNSVADTIRSSIYSHPGDYVYEAATVSPLASKLAEIVDLTREPSNKSLTSVDAEGKHRPSFAMKRMTSMASTGSSNSTATSFTHINGHNNSTTPRFGFTRALLSETSHRSSVSSLRNHKSTEHLRNLARRSSRSSINTKDSVTTHKCASDDTFSMISFGEVPQLNLLQLHGQEQYRVENFNVADFQDPLDLKLELQGAPYLKEGLLKLRILNNDMADHSASEANISSASLALSALTTKSGFFSFFLRSSNKEVTPATALGTNHSNVFGSKSTEYFVVVSKGELRLYSFDSRVIKKQQQKMKKYKEQHAFYEDADKELDKDLGDGNWLNNAAHIGDYNLCATVARFEKNSHHLLHSSAEKVTFSLTFPRVSKKPQKKFVFEAGTVEVANEFVNTCNFWASKLTAVPTLEESVSSIEYGWTNLDGLINMGEGFKKAKSISRWEALPKGVYLSNLSSVDPSEDYESPNHEGMLKQFVQTLKYYNNLKTLFNAFNRQKSHFMKLFRKYANSSNYKLVMQNYEARSHEYKVELNKYKSYITMLGYGLKLRFDLELEDRLVFWAEQIMELPDLEKPEAISEEIERRKKEALENDSELTKVVKAELERLIRSSSSMKKLLAETCHPIQETNEVSHPMELSEQTEIEEGDPANASLVKSPKTFSLSHYKDAESSPVSQLLSADRNNSTSESGQQLNLIQAELVMSFSTNTIKEEEEPEDCEEEMKKIPA